MEITTNAFASGLGSLQAGQRRAEQAAGEITGSAAVQPAPGNAGASSQVSERRRPEMAESLVALRVAEHEVRAGARVIETADEALGTLIDTRA